MTGEELCTKLYQRMTAEQEQYRNWLLGQPPADILNHAAEYTVREDIVMEMSALELPEAPATMNIMFINDRKPVADRMFTEKYGTHQCMLAVRENVMRNPPRHGGRLHHQPGAAVWHGGHPGGLPDYHPGNCRGVCA